MERKAFAVSEVKASTSKGEFEALVSVFGNVDSGGDRILPGAFQKAIDNDPPPPIVWAHQWSLPPIGETLDWSESSKSGKEGLWIKGALFVEEDDRHQYADMVYSAMKSRGGRSPALKQFSFAYDVEEAETATEDGGDIRELKSLYPIPEVGPCLRGMNRETELLSAPKFWNGTAPTSMPQVATTLALPTATANLAYANLAYTVDEVPKNDEQEEAERPVIRIPAWRFPPLHASSR